MDREILSENQQSIFNNTLVNPINNNQFDAFSSVTSSKNILYIQTEILHFKEAAHLKKHINLSTLQKNGGFFGSQFFSQALIETCDTHMSRSSGNTKFEFDCRYKIKYFSKLDAFKQRSYSIISNIRLILYFICPSVYLLYRFYSAAILNRVLIFCYNSAYKYSSTL